MSNESVVTDKSAPRPPSGRNESVVTDKSASRPPSGRNESVVADKSASRPPSRRNEDVCAPGKYDAKNDTCFNQKQLTEMAKAYNRYITKKKLHPSDNKLDDKADLIKNPDADVPTLLKEFRKRFGKIDDRDLSQREFMKGVIKEIDSAFRPQGPKDPIEWLSTLDINAIMNQYHQVYPDFRFLGAVPSDCDIVKGCTLNQFDFEEYRKDGIKQLGIIFNLDKHNQPGSHWVALYINMKDGYIYYCDSVGNEPSAPIKHFINQFKTYYKQKTGKEATFQHNTKSYQKDGSECGIYSCNFLIRMLAGEPFEDITNNSLPFEGINGCRNKYFNNKPSKFKVNELCDPK